MLHQLGLSVKQSEKYFIISDNHHWIHSVYCFVFSGDFGDRYFGTDGSDSWSDEENQKQPSHWLTSVTENTKSTWKLLLLCILLFRPRPAKRICYIHFLCTVHEILYSYATDESRTGCMHEGYLFLFTTECSSQIFSYLKGHYETAVKQCHYLSGIIMQ